MNSKNLRRCRRLAVVCVLGATAMLACSVDTPSGPNRLSPHQSGPSNGSVDADFGIDLPCEVATLLLEHCAACHTGAQGFAPALARHEDLLAPSSQPDMTVAEASLASMRGLLTPMPPSGLLAADTIAPFEKWIADGMPSGTCEGLVPPPAPELVCSSGTYRNRGDDDDANMFPGRACNHCHQGASGEEDDEAPVYAFAGTVYPTVREPNGCVGRGGAVVTLTDNAGRTWQLTTRPGSGNFAMGWPTSGLTFPVTASVTANGATIEMMQPLMSPAEGDCNLCHTQDGANGAPGRIFTP
jgi:hypothetical protein